MKFSTAVVSLITVAPLVVGAAEESRYLKTGMVRLSIGSLLVGSPGCLLPQRLSLLL
jgi:hypothetical protein